MAEEPSAPTSIAARIAALKLDQNASPIPKDSPPSYRQATAGKCGPPPLPPKRPQNAMRSQTTNNPPLQTNALASQPTIGNLPISSSGKELVAPPTTRYTGRNGGQRPELPARPELPPRPSPTSNGAAPALPPRKASTPSLNRRESQESIASTRSARSTYSIQSNGTSLSTRTSFSDNNPARSVKAPPYDPSTLPPLSERRAKDEREQARASLKPTYTSPAAVPRVGPTSDLPLKAIEPTPPALPARRQNSAPAQPSIPVRNGLPRRSALEFGMNRSTEAPPQMPKRPGSDAPPPIPLGSRPDLAALQASKPKPGAVPDASSCLHCRDFSAVDAHAARFLRQNLPSLDISWLAHQLCDPFPSHTDKARAIFTFLHHNIEYNVEAFFNNSLKPSTPGSTLATGLAVCEGYAGLFSALALAAGLEAIVVSGGSKGFGYKQLAPGEPLPLFKSTHAWNAVKIDNGEWKLIDACWGAGAIGEGRSYIKRFEPAMFTRDNAEFGKRHFPSDPSKWYAPPMTWEQFLLCDGVEEKVTVCGASNKEGIKEDSYLPLAKVIRKDRNLGPTVRFSCHYVCRHYNEKVNKGQPRLLVLCYGKEFVPMNTDGFFWWLDVDRSKLESGTDVMMVTMLQFDGRDGRGLSAEQFKARLGRQNGWDCTGTATWTAE